MKKLAVLLVALVAVFSVAKADDDRPIEVSQLPKTAQVFVKKYFSNKKVALAKEDSGLFSSTYEVMFTDGSKVEFDKNGNWDDVSCQNMPAGIVPKAILAKVKSMSPNLKVVKIDRRDNGGYEIELSNRQELEFNKKLQLVDLDD